MAILLDETDMLKVLNEFVSGFDSYRDAAKYFEVDHAFLYMCVKGRCRISDRLASKLGYERGYYYRQVKGGSDNE